MRHRTGIHFHWERISLQVSDVHRETFRPVFLTRSPVSGCTYHRSSVTTSRSSRRESGAAPLCVPLADTLFYRDLINRRKAEEWCACNSLFRVNVGL